MAFQSLHWSRFVFSNFSAFAQRTNSWMVRMLN